MSYGYTELKVINFALNNIGREAVSNINDSNDAKMMSNKLPALLQDLLLRTNWNFARVYLEDSTPITKSLSHEYKFTYQLPANFGFLEIIRNKTNYLFMGDKILSNDDIIKYYYIANNADYSDMTPPFFMALAYYLSANTALANTNNPTLQEENQKQYMYYLDSAIRQNDTQRFMVKIPSGFDRVNLV